jgi:gliding motility-associated-like protein
VLSPGVFSQYTWQDNSNGPQFVVTKPGTYWVNVVDQNGCASADTVVILSGNCLNPRIPNTFTPNGDGVNDTWQINGLASFPQCSVFIYTRWGQLVFKSTGYDHPWNGRENGKELPIGAYYYVINLKNNTPPISGYVTIIR